MITIKINVVRVVSDVVRFDLFPSWSGSIKTGSSLKLNLSIAVTSRCVLINRNCLSFSSTTGGIRVAHLFSFLCCVFCLFVLCFVPNVAYSFGILKLFLHHPLSNHFLLFTIFLNMGKYSPRDLGITMFVPPKKCTSGTRDLFIWTEDD